MSAPQPVRRAAALVAVEGVALVAIGVVLTVLSLTGSPHDLALSLTAAAMAFIAGVVLVVLARALRGARRAALSPTVLVQVILLPIGYSLLRGGQPAVGAGALALGVAVLGLLFATRDARDVFR